MNPILQTHLENKREFEEKYKCIQGDCDGNGHIPTGNEEEGYSSDQCQFHADEWSGAGMWEAVEKVINYDGNPTTEYLDKLLKQAEEF